MLHLDFLSYFRIRQDLHSYYLVTSHEEAEWDEE